jgi:hypothetical protein
VKLSKLQIFELNTLVQKKTSGDVEGKPPSDSFLSRGSADHSLTYRNVRPVLRVDDEGGDSVSLAAATVRHEVNAWLGIIIPACCVARTLLQLCSRESRFR